MCCSLSYIHRMAKNKEMTPTMRARICELHSIGWGYRKIHTRYPQIPVSTIRYTILNENDRDDHASKPRSGRPPVLSPEQKDLLHRLVTENPHIKMRELQAAVGTSPSKHNCTPYSSRTSLSVRAKRAKRLQPWWMIRPRLNSISHSITIATIRICIDDSSS